MPESTFDLDKNVPASLKAWSDKQKAEAAAKGLTTAAEPPNTNIQTTTAPPVAIPPAAAVVSPTTPAPAAVAPPAESVIPAATVTSAPAEEPPSTDAKIDDEPAPEPWDKELTIKTLPDETDVPLKLEDIGSALKFDKPLKNKAELVEHYNGLRKEIEDLKAKEGTSNTLDGLDDDLKEVLKVAQSKGDWKRLLGTLVGDVSNVDPVLLFEAEIEKAPQFIDPATGKRDEEAISAELASIPLGVKITQGNLMKQQLVAQQNQRRQQILQATERRQTEFNRTLAEASRKIAEILPQEKYGIKLEPKHSDYLYEGIRSGKLIEKHLGKNIDISGVNSAKLIETIAKAEWAENISKYQSSQGEVRGQKKLLARVQNVQLNPSSLPPEPNQRDNKPKTAAEKTRDYVNKFSPGPNSL